MKGLILSVWLLLCCGQLAVASEETNRPTVVIATNYGEITVELAPDMAPKTVANFLNYCNNHFYDGLVFHRVVKGFVIQAGGHWYDLSNKPPKFEPVINESINGLQNLRGTIAMARGSDPDSADAQFFINLRNNLHLNADGQKPGYTVFGRVVEGMAIVDQIGQAPVVRATTQLTHVPIEPIQIQSTTVHP